MAFFSIYNPLRYVTPLGPASSGGKPVFRRSNTDVEMKVGSKIGHTLRTRISKTTGSHIQDEAEAAKERKRMQKLWQDSYLAMCHRAAAREPPAIAPSAEVAASSASSKNKKKKRKRIKRRPKPLPLKSSSDVAAQAAVASPCSSISSIDMSSSEVGGGSVRSYESYINCRSMLPTASAGIVETKVFGTANDLSVGLRHVDSIDSQLDFRAACGANQEVASICSIETASALPIAMVAHVLEMRKSSIGTDSLVSPEHSQPAQQQQRQPYLNSDSYDSKFTVDCSTQVNLCKFDCSRSESPESRPLERAVEARTGSEDGLGSMVRCLHFAHTFIANRKYNH